MNKSIIVTEYEYLSKRRIVNGLNSPDRSVVFYYRLSKLEKIKNFIKPSDEFFDIFLMEHTSKKIRTYKLVKDLLGCQLMRSMEIVNDLPHKIMGKVTKNEASFLKKIFENNGDIIEIRTR